MTDITPGQQRLLALRAEMAGLWGDAAKAWHKAIALLPTDMGIHGQKHRDEMVARARSAEALAAEPMALVENAGVVEAKAKVEDKPEEERIPGGVTHLEPGETQGTSGSK